MSMFKDIPVDVSVIYEGERIRRNDMQVELGGPAIKEKFELAKVKPMDEIEDGKITIIGPDIKDLKEGDAYPLGILVEAAGPTLDQALEGVIERRIHGYMNYIEGFMHLNQRYDIWIRLNKKSFQKGLNSFEYIGKVLHRLFKSELPIIEKVQITFITDPAKVQELYPLALADYETRDAKARGLKDEEVDKFYGCVLCQSFAPSHVCVITPQRYSNCGAISWFDGRASASIDPKVPVFAIDRGELINAEKGEYSGVTVNGLAFSTLADSTAGGRQVDGFHGMSIEYMRSQKFLSADGGWDRVVWLPKEIKERVKDFIPKEVVDKIATEENAQNIDALKAFLKEKAHPVVV